MFYAKIYSHSPGKRIYLGKSPIIKDVLGYCLFIPKEMTLYGTSKGFDITLPGILTLLRGHRLLRIKAGDYSCVRRISDPLSIAL